MTRDRILDRLGLDRVDLGFFAAYVAFVVVILDMPILRALANVALSVVLLVVLDEIGETVRWRRWARQQRRVQPPERNPRE